MEEFEVVLQEFKKHLGQASLIFKSKIIEPLQLYLAVTSDAINSVLIWEKRGHQLLVYYVGKVLITTETHYQDMENWLSLLQRLSEN